MEARVFKPYLTVLGLMALTSLALAFTVDVKLADEAGIEMALPDRVAGWTGEELRFCQNKGCEKAFGVLSLERPDVCPACGGVLSSMAKVEKDLLPPDTSVIKKRYANAAGREIVVSIVLSGRERASIHRPEVCLVGQGTEITRRATLEVPIAGRAPLGVKVLDIQQWWRGADGRRMEADSYYAYWFAGKDRETPDHLQRMIWMATDRVLRGVAHRWAYIAISGSRDRASESFRDELREFVGGLYPALHSSRRGGEN
jgi:hypothetical protein